MPEEQPRSIKSKQARVHFEDFWPGIRNVLDKALRDALLAGREPTKLGNLSYAQFIDLYTKLYNLTTSSDEENICKLYSSLVDYFFKIADEMLSHLSARSEEQGFLLSYLEAYDHFLSAAILLPHAFRIFDAHWLKYRRNDWFSVTPGAKDVPPGMRLVAPPMALNRSRAGETGLGGNANSRPNGDKLLVPKERAVISEDIMWWDAATAAGAPDAEDIAKLIWPPRDKPGFLGDGPIEIIQGREKVQLEARQYSSLPANVYMQLKPTLLRLWRLATVKHLGSDYDPSLIRVIHRLQETGELKECVQLVSRLAKCFWAIGVLEQDMGFPELIRVLEAEVPK